MFGMKIEKVKKLENALEVATTGVRYVFKAQDNKGVILCYQRIGKKRLTATIILSCSIKDLVIMHKDEDLCILHKSKPPTEGELKIRINSDSLISLRSGKPTKVTVKSDVVPEYSAFEGSNFIVIDDFGGIALYPQPFSARWAPEASVLSLKFLKKSWETSVFLEQRQELLISIFPPRPFDEAKSYRDRIVHPSIKGKPYPDNQQLKEWSKFGNIFVFHSQIWRGKYTTKVDVFPETATEGYANAPWASYEHVLRDEKKFLQAIHTAHKYGMKVLPYMRPLQSCAEGEEFLSQASKVLNKYPVDGLYLDANVDNLKDAYILIKGLRKLLGGKLLYMHMPSPIIGRCYKDGYYVYEPFIDTYADYILRSEHMMNFDWHHLRYTISGYNISNAIGFVCNYDYPPPFVKSIVDKVLLAHAGLPYWPGEWLSALHLRKERDSDDTTEKEIQKIMREDYFPKLELAKQGKLSKVSEIAKEGKSFRPPGPNTSIPDFDEDL